MDNDINNESYNLFEAYSYFNKRSSSDDLKESRPNYQKISLLNDQFVEYRYLLYLYFIEYFLKFQFEGCDCPAATLPQLYLRQLLCRAAGFNLSTILYSWNSSPWGTFPSMQTLSFLFSQNYFCYSVSQTGPRQYHLCSSVCLLLLHLCLCPLPCTSPSASAPAFSACSPLVCLCLCPWWIFNSRDCPSYH